MTDTDFVVMSVGPATLPIVVEDSVSSTDPDWTIPTDMQDTFSVVNPHWRHIRYGHFEAYLEVTQILFKDARYGATEKIIVGKILGANTGQ